MLLGVIFQEFASSNATMFILDDTSRGALITANDETRSKGDAAKKKSHVFMLPGQNLLMEPNQAQPLESSRFNILQVLSGWKAGTYFRGITRCFDWSNITLVVDVQGSERESHSVVRSQSTRSRKTEPLWESAKLWTRNYAKAISSVMEVLYERL